MPLVSLFVDEGGVASGDICLATVGIRRRRQQDDAVAVPMVVPNYEDHPGVGLVNALEWQPVIVRLVLHAVK